jgi:hypothetical protein
MPPRSQTRDGPSHPTSQLSKVVEEWRANYRLLDLASLFEGLAKTAETEDAAGVALFSAAAFLGLRISRFDLI